MRNITLLLLFTLGFGQDFSPSENDELLFECYMPFTSPSSCTSPNLGVGGTAMRGILSDALSRDPFGPADR